MDKQVTKKWWDEHMENNYFTDFIFVFSRPDLIARFNLQKQSNILEIGFGYGRETSQFCKLSDNVFGVDLAENAKNIAYAKIKEQGITNLPNLQSYDGNRLPFDDGKFDFMYSCFVIQHMSKNSAIELLKESKRVLKDSGKIMFEFFGEKLYYKPGIQEDAFSGIANAGGMYNNAFTPVEIKTMADLAGLKIEWIEEQHIDVNFTNYWVCLSKGI